MSSISPFDSVSVVVPDPKIFLCIPASYALKIILANSLIIFFINDNPVFNHEPRSLPRNPPSCII